MSKRQTKGLPRPISEKQAEFLSHSDTRVTILEGSIRSGKTFIALIRWLFFVAMAPANGALVMVGRTQDSVWRNMIEPLQEPSLFGPYSKHVVGNFGANRIKIFSRTVYVLGASDVSSELVLRGLTVAGCIVDEATTLHVNFFKQLLGRMSKDGAQMFATTNPDSPAHWLKKEYLDRIDSESNPLRGWKRYRFFLEDNPSNSQKYIDDIKSEYTGLWYKRFIDGAWVAAEGAVFDFWDEEKYVIPHEKLPLMRRIYGVGVDFGSDHPSAAILLGHGVDNKLYFFNEWDYVKENHQGSLSGYQQAKLLIKFLEGDLLPPREDPNEDAQQKSLRPMNTVVDAAARDFIISLEEQGVDNFRASNKDVLEGIRTMSSMLTTGRLLISDRCKGLIREIPGYSWDPKKSLMGIEEPVKVADDRIDPARYILMSTQSDWYDPLLYNY